MHGQQNVKKVFSLYTAMFNVKKFYLLPREYNYLLCMGRITERTINLMIFIIKIVCVYCEVRGESLKQRSILIFIYTVAFTRKNKRSNVRRMYH